MESLKMNDVLSCGWPSLVFHNCWIPELLCNRLRIKQFVGAFGTFFRVPWMMPWTWHSWQDYGKLSDSTGTTTGACRKPWWSCIQPAKWQPRPRYYYTNTFEAYAVAKERGATGKASGQRRQRQGKGQSKGQNNSLESLCFNFLLNLFLMMMIE